MWLRLCVGVGPMPSRCCGGGTRALRARRAAAARWVRDRTLTPLTLVRPPCRGFCGRVQAFGAGGRPDVECGPPAWRSATCARRGLLRGLVVWPAWRCGCLNSNSRCTNRFVRSSWLTPAAVSAIDQAKLRRPGLMCGLRRVDRNHASVQPGRVGMAISPAHEADSFLCCHSAEWLLMAETAAASTPEPRAWHRLAPARHRKASTPYLL